SAGKNVFDYQTQALFASAVELDTGSKEYSTMLTNSLEGQRGSATFSTSGSRNAYAYSPVYVDNKLFGSLHTTTPQTLDANIAVLVQQQKNVSTLMIIVVGAAAAGIATTVLTWNSRLDTTVREKTQQLNESKKHLEASNKQLARTTEDLRLALAELAENNKKLRAANEQLLQHDKMQQEFIRVAAHELRTPVQPLLGVADILTSQFEELSNDRDKIEVSRAEIEMIVRNATRLERLSSDILQVSRIESQSLKLDRETFDLNAKIRGVVKDMRSFIPIGKQLKIFFEPFSMPLVVNADKVKIFEILSNILRNAIKFTEEGAIIVSSDKSADNQYAVVTVKDTGTGIDSEILPRLFKKFVVGHCNQYDTRTGSGLGLYISKGIVEAHGGKIWAENNLNGCGATFHFTIPLATTIVS
ncbi:MAG: HAMP domain-containing sensor histidine kinase, partial [Thermoproteota archaeon]